MLVVGQFGAVARLHQDVWAFREEDLRLGFVQTHALVVPAAALEEESVDVGSVLGFKVGVVLDEDEVEGDLIDGDSISTRVVLEHTCEETLGEEEA